MTASPDLLRELRASRPVAPTALRTRVREAARAEPAPGWWASLRIPARRIVAVAVPAGVGIAILSAAAIGLSRAEPRDVFSDAATSVDAPGTREAAPGSDLGVTTQDSTVGPTPGRAQRVSATLTVEVDDPEAVSKAAQDALDLTRTLGGHVVSASVATGEQGSASLTVRVPVAKVQQAITELSALGRIVAQEVTIDDLQESLDALERRQGSLRAQIARITARLETETLDAETRAVLEARLKRLRDRLREVRRDVASTSAEARMSTIHLTVVTPELLGVAPEESRLDRVLDEALNVLVWEGVVALAVAIVVAPVALVAVVAWLGRRFYRRREDERLLST